MEKITLDNLQVGKSYRFISGDCYGVYPSETFTPRIIYHGKYASCLSVELLPEKLKLKVTFWKDCIFEKV